jgi:tRNA uridine 5-carboxymethylaminomethyl modification enzyme
MARHEDKRIPADLDYSAIRGLKKEAQVNFTRIRPATLGQAGRISGITPADVAILAVWMEKGAPKGEAVLAASGEAGAAAEGAG